MAYEFTLTLIKEHFTYTGNYMKHIQEKVLCYSCKQCTNYMSQWIDYVQIPTQKKKITKRTILEI